jgi:xylulokinase
MSTSRLEEDMKMQYVIGVDIGTTGAKTIVFDQAGEPVSSAYQEYSCIYPHPAWIEQDADSLVEAAVKTVAEAFAKSGLNKDDVVSMAFSTQRSCTIFLDSQGHPLRNMISWQDNRVGEEVAEMEAKVFGDRYFDITGLPIGATWLLPKIMWYRKNEPEKWSKTVRVAQLHDYIFKKFGAEEYLVPNTDMGLSGVWNLTRNCFEEEFLKIFNIEAKYFSGLTNVGIHKGTISKEIATRTGLSEKTLLCTGAGDQSAAALGAGIMSDGDLSVSMGTGGMMIMCVDKGKTDPHRAFLATEHATGEKWQWEGLQKGSAGIYRWFRDEIAGTETAEAKAGNLDTYDVLSKKAAEVPPGARGLIVLPYFAASGTPHWNINSRGAILGLTFAHDRACLTRAFMEGITMEHKDMLVSLKMSGLCPKKITIMGGPTKSELWNKIQASMYGLPVQTLKMPDASVLGVAIAAAAGAKLYGNLEEAAAAMVKTVSVIDPVPDWQKVYETQYECYEAAYEDLNRTTFAKMARSQAE